MLTGALPVFLASFESSSIQRLISREKVFIGRRLSREQLLVKAFMETSNDKKVVDCQTVSRTTRPPITLQTACQNSEIFCCGIFNLHQI
jgi:hypothetical protein